MKQILIVDDIPVDIEILSALLKKSYEVWVTDNGTNAVQIAEANQPDLILLDVIMPGMDGFSTCVALKSNEKTAEIPIIFISPRKESEDIIKGFSLGGVDYITKPFNPAEVIARVKTHLDLKNIREELKKYAHRLEELNKELCFKNNQLNEAYEDLRIAAMTDPLTKLANRRYLIEKIGEEIIRFKRNERAFSIVLSDVDNFKDINDQYGHECGDYVLIYISDLMGSMIRQQDCISRWGGEEFLLLLTETDADGARVVAEKIRSRIQRSEIIYKDKKIFVTMTFGIATFSEDDDMNDTIKRADDALYIGKVSGRNYVVNL